MLAKHNLKKNQKELGLPQHSIIQPEPTRWNSMLHMMLEQKRALNIYSGEYGKIAPPSSSVPSERVFSEIGNIYNKRSRLTGEHAEQLCSLHDNLPFLNWEYGVLSVKDG